MNTYPIDPAFLAIVANARSASAADDIALTAAGLIRTDTTGWLSLTAAGQAILHAAGYIFNPKCGHGWRLKEASSPQASHSDPRP